MNHRENRNALRRMVMDAGLPDPCPPFPWAFWASAVLLWVGGFLLGFSARGQVVKWGWTP